MHFRLLSNVLAFSFVLLLSISPIAGIFASPVTIQSEFPTVDVQSPHYHTQNYPSNPVRSVLTTITTALFIRTPCLNCRRHAPSPPAPPKNVDPYRPNGPYVPVKGTIFCQPTTAGDFEPYTYHQYLTRRPKPKMDVFWISTNAKHFLAKTGKVKVLPHKEDDPTSRFYFCNNNSKEPRAPLASEYKKADEMISEACGKTEGGGIRGGGVAFGPASAENLGVNGSSTMTEVVYARWANFGDEEKAGKFLCDFKAMFEKYGLKSNRGE